MEYLVFWDSQQMHLRWKNIRKVRYCPKIRTIFGSDLVAAHFPSEK